MAGRRRARTCGTCCPRASTGPEREIEPGEERDVARYGELMELSCAIVGTGVIAGFHAEALAGRPGPDRRGDRHRRRPRSPRTARSGRCPRCTRPWTTLLDHEKPDLVDAVHAAGPARAAGDCLPVARGVGAVREAAGAEPRRAGRDRVAATGARSSRPCSSTGSAAARPGCAALSATRRARPAAGRSATRCGSAPDRTSTCRGAASGTSRAAGRRWVTASTSSTCCSICGGVDRGHGVAGKQARPHRHRGRLVRDRAVRVRRGRDDHEHVVSPRESPISGSTTSARPSSSTTSTATRAMTGESRRRLGTIRVPRRGRPADGMRSSTPPQYEVWC